MNLSTPDAYEEVDDLLAFNSSYLTLAMMSLVLVSVFGSFGSLCVLLVFLRKRSLRTVSNYFTIALMIACLVGDIQCFPLQIMLDLLVFTSQPQCYLAGGPIISWSVQITLYLLAITVERYITICKPLRVDSIITPNRAIFSLVSIAIYGYLFGFVLAGLTWIGKGNIWHLNRRCDLAFFAPNELYAPVLFAHWLINIPIMGIIYIHIFLTVRKHIRQIAVFRPEGDSEHMSTVANRRRSHSRNIRQELTFSIWRNTRGQTNRILEAKSALRLSVVFALYAINWLSIQYFIVRKVLASESTGTNEYILFHLLTYSVGITSPYIYGFGNKLIRKEVIEMFHSLWGKLANSREANDGSTWQATSMVIPRVTLDTGSCQ